MSTADSRHHRDGRHTKEWGLSHSKHTQSRYIAILQHASSAITAKSAAADKKDGYGIMVVEK